MTKYLQENPVKTHLRELIVMQKLGLQFYYDLKLWVVFYVSAYLKEMKANETIFQPL